MDKLDQATQFASHYSALTQQILMIVLIMLALRTYRVLKRFVPASRLSIFLMRRDQGLWVQQAFAMASQHRTFKHLTPVPNSSAYMANQASSRWKSQLGADAAAQGAAYEESKNIKRA